MIQPEKSTDFNGKTDGKLSLSLMSDQGGRLCVDFPGFYWKMKQDKAQREEVDMKRLEWGEDATDCKTWDTQQDVQTRMLSLGHSWLQRSYH